MNGSRLGYSEKEVDSALDMLESCPGGEEGRTAGA